MLFAAVINLVVKWNDRSGEFAIVAIICQIFLRDPVVLIINACKDACQDHSELSAVLILYKFKDNFSARSYRNQN